MSFASLGLSAELLRGAADLGWTEPTPIQRDAIPPALAGRDVLACAMTGSGKTAAFLLPILARLSGRPRGSVRALVLAPTRELAAQIHEHLTALAAHTPVTGAAIFGGVAMGPQERALRQGVDVLIATPGRLLDHFSQGYARLDALEVLVLDEADRMLDMGFLPDIRRVLAYLPKTPRQTLFFSATLPPPIVALSREMLKSPAAINVERRAAPATGVAQAVYMVPESRKAALLIELLKRGDIENVLVFTRTKHRTNRLAEHLMKQGVSCDRLHGNRSQAQRTLALANFKSGKTRVLVATDIAARGIDVEALSHVVNFDVPHVPEDYIHRVGRTARAEAEGDAFTFASADEQSDLAAIERAIGKRLPRLTVPGFDYTAKAGERLEIPIAERIAAIRAKKAEDRARSREKAERKAQNATQEEARRAQKSAPGGARRPATGHPTARPSGDRNARPSGDRTARPSGDRNARPSGDRTARPGRWEGDRRRAPGPHRGGHELAARDGRYRRAGAAPPHHPPRPEALARLEEPPRDAVQQEAPTGFNRRRAPWAGRKGE
jgi:ATP-dependent RNA helicase RhlE